MNAEKLKIWNVPAVTSMSYAHNEGAWETLNAHLLSYTEMYTHEHGNKTHKWTQAISTNTLLRTLSLLCLYQTHSPSHATVKQLHIFYASSDDLPHQHSPVKNRLNRNSETTPLPINCALCGPFVNIRATKRPVADFMAWGRLWRQQRMCEWDCWCETASFILL